MLKRKNLYNPLYPSMVKGRTHCKKIVGSIRDPHFQSKMGQGTCASKANDRAGLD